MLINHLQTSHVPSNHQAALQSQRRDGETLVSWAILVIQGEISWRLLSHGLRPLHNHPEILRTCKTVPPQPMPEAFAPCHKIALMPGAF